MKKTVVFLFAVISSALLSSEKAAAQNMESGYFLDNYTYCYRLNPALMPDNNFIAIGLGNFSTGVTSKFGLGSFLYPGPDGKLVTGFHKSVSPSDFLSGFSKANKIGENIKVNLLSFGIRRDNTMSTVELNVRENLSAALPGDLFGFLKEGSSPDPYDLSRLRAGADAMVELALGHTRRYGKFVYGLRAKLLFGAAGGEMSFDRLDLVANGGEVGIGGKARIKVACEPLQLLGSSDNPLYVEDVIFSLENMGVAGFGVGFDLGVKWYINDDLSATFGINDLGAMSWKYNNVLGAECDAIFKGFEDVDTDTDIEKAFDDFLEEIEDDAKIIEGEKSKELSMLPFSMNAGVRYRMPFYNRLSVGALVNFEHSRFGDIAACRAGATITPVNWFSLTGNIGYSNYGGLAGCMASLTMVGINFFAGFDCYCGKCGKVQFSDLGMPVDGNLPIENLAVPLNAFQYRFTGGINIQFGKRRADYIHPLIGKKK